MPATNFMAEDLRAILVSFCLFSPVAVGPGYTIGSLLDVMRFRSRTLTGQIVLSVPLSIALAPVLTYFIGRWVSLNAAWLVFAGLSVYAAVALTRDLWKKRASLNFNAKIGALVCAWIVVAVLSLADMQVGQRLYFSIVGYDHFVRTSFTAAISTFGIPPPNPFYFPGHPVALRYHYFWLAETALVHHIAFPLVEARQAFVGGTIWCGIGLICVIALYLRFFSPMATSGLARRTFVGVCLLGVTGLDLIPTLLLLSLERLGLVNALSPSVEWWNNQIDGWLYTMLWEPHYLAGLIACLTGFLITWTISQNASRRECIVGAIAAGLAYSTAVGAALYVAMVFALFLLCWLLICTWKKWSREAFALAGAGLIAIAASAPFVVALQEPASGGRLLQPTVRSFPIGEAFLSVVGFTRPWQVALGNALFLPLNYFLELGFFLAAAKILWDRFRARKRAASRYELAAFTMVCASAGTCTFLKSGVIQNNDLGWRGFLPAQFALLILAADLWANRTNAPIRPRQKNVLSALLIVGAAGVLYDVTILRFFPLLSDAGVVPKIAWLAQDQNLGARTYANRQAYAWLRANTPPRTVIQQNPSPILQDTFYGLYANRQTVAVDTACGAVFGGDLRECGPIVRRLAGLFSGGESSRPAAFGYACSTLPIGIFVAKDTDASWADRTSWVWARKPLYSNGYVRLFACEQEARNLVLTYRGKNRD